MLYSSKDFAKVPSSPTTQIPDKLIHKNVPGSAEDAAFSSERKHPVALIDLPSKTISATLGKLRPAQATNRHRHNYETILYVLEGRGETVIEDRVIPWEKGDAVYVPVWAWHHHRNLSETADASYLACENAPLLQNLGGIALREEGGPR